MGILNVTPDSFYDGGQYSSVENAVKRAMEMLEAGADIIDIGGESTGPGSSGVPLEEELRRVVPVVEGVQPSPRLRPTGRCQVSGVRMSVDTYKAEVARQAIEAGVEMVNDVTAGRGDPEMFRLIAQAGCSYIMMRSKDNAPRTTRANTQYEDVMKTIHAFFEERLEEALKAGIKKEQIILDPGLGHFVSSDPRYSFEILERLEELADFGCPILVSPSRKSFTAGSENLPPEKRLENTLAATKLAIEHGASIIRTHDVAATKELLRF